MNKDMLRKNFDKRYKELNFDRIDDNILNNPISVLNLYPKAYNALRRAGICTIGQLRSMKKSDIWDIGNIASVSFQEIEYKIHLLGLRFADERNVIKTNNCDPKVMEDSIKILNLDARLINLLHSRNIYTVGSLINRRLEDLESIQGIGNKYIRKVLNEVHSLGLFFIGEGEISLNKSAFSKVEDEVNFLEKDNKDTELRISRKEQLVKKLMLLKEEQIKLAEQEKILDNELSKIMTELSEIKKYGKVKR